MLLWSFWAICHRQTDLRTQICGIRLLHDGFQAPGCMRSILFLHLSGTRIYMLLFVVVGSFVQAVRNQD